MIMRTQTALFSLKSAFYDLIELALAPELPTTPLSPTHFCLSQAVQSSVCGRSPEAVGRTKNRQSPFCQTHMSR